MRPFSNPTIEGLRDLANAKYFSPFDNSPDAREAREKTERACREALRPLRDALRREGAIPRTFGIGFQE